MPIDNLYKLTSYQPIQPSVSAPEQGVAYREIRPMSSLGKYVCCYWQLSSTHYHENGFTYRVASDGCIDIFFDAGNPQDVSVMGFCDRFVEFNLPHQFNYIGIRFWPLAFPVLTGVDAIHLSNKVSALQNVLPSSASFIDSIIPGQDLEAVARLLDAHFMTYQSGTNATVDERVAEAVAIILERKGSLDVQRDLNTGLSPRQMRRLFDRYIGTTPKVFATVIRFQHSLRLNDQKQGKGTKVVFDLAYHDQAHFTKEFKKFYGLTPGSAFPGKQPTN